MPKVGKGKPQKINDIAEALLPLAVDCARLRLDPNNARIHGQRSIDGIKQSLQEFGQVKVIVVRKQDMTVAAGNGTLEAARALGWTKVAANVMSMTDAQFTAYALTDNRLAELSSFDPVVVAQLERLIADAGGPMVGWTEEELAVLRQNCEEHRPIQGTEEGEQSWQELWKGMPEFDQKDQTSFKSIVVHFRNEQDYLAFLKKVGQTTTDVRQRSIWHPKAEIGRFADKRYVAEGTKK